MESNGGCKDFRSHRRKQIALLCVVLKIVAEEENEPELAERVATKACEYLEISKEYAREVLRSLSKEIAEDEKARRS